MPKVRRAAGKRGEQGVEHGLLGAQALDRLASRRLRYVLKPILDDRIVRGHRDWIGCAGYALPQSRLSALRVLISCRLGHDSPCKRAHRADTPERAKGIRLATELGVADLAAGAAVDYWVPARASPVEPGSLGRDDSHS